MGLTKQEINSLLGVADKATHEAVQAKIKESFDKLQPHMPNLGYWGITVKYDLRGTTAGQAWGKSKIRLNLDLLMNPTTQDHLLNVTVPHEVAHCVVSHVWGKAEKIKSHGYEWEYVMRCLGLEPERTHHMPVESVRKTQKFKYRCGCGIHMIGLNRHKKCQAQDDYALTCRTCGQILQYAGD